MRKLIIAGLVVGAMGLASPVFADNPGGTSEPALGDGQSNNVDCGTEGQDVGATGLTVAGLPDSPTPGTSGGLVLCNDGGDGSAPSPIQGRVIASGTADGPSGYVAIDGDKNNDPRATGYIRASSDATVQCGDDKAANGTTVDNHDTDAGNPAPSDAPVGPVDSDCDPR